jgi:hypothetical protein
VFCLFAVACLAACTEVVDSATETRYGQYNYTTDWAKNEAILLNIVRASFYQPLNFLVYQTYTGTATAMGTASSPAFIVGPDRVASQKQYSFGGGALSVSGTGSGSISVQNLDTQDFYGALLSPIDFTNLYAFQRQGYPRELLFRLFADYVALKPPIDQDPQGRESYVIYNDPLREKSCISIPEQTIDAIYPRQMRASVSSQICFGDLVRFALLSGISSEIRNIPAPKQRSNTASKPAAGTTTPSSDTGSGSGTPMPATEARLCFDGALANNARMEFSLRPPPPWGDDPVGLQMFLDAVRAADYHPVCGGKGPDDVWPPSQQQGAGKGGAAAKSPTTSSNQSAGTNTLTVSPKTLTGQLIWDIHKLRHNTVEIGTRSTFAIYNFLGRLLNYQDNEINTFVGPHEPGDDSRVLTVHKGQPAGCFVAAVFDLAVYCVPVDGAENTKRSFSIVSQLLALKTPTSDLQLQPIFRLQPQ